MTDHQRIYRIHTPEGYEWVMPTDNTNFEVFRALWERPWGALWEPIHMSLIKPGEHGPPPRRAAMPWLGGYGLVLRDEAIESVGEILQPHGELLPLVCDDARLVLFSPPVLDGVLDEVRSVVTRDRNGGIMQLKVPVFRMAALGGVEAFKLAETPRVGMYLTEDLVEAIRSTGDTAGTIFDMVYEESSRPESD